MCILFIKSNLLGRKWYEAQIIILWEMNDLLKLIKRYSGVISSENKNEIIRSIVLLISIEKKTAQNISRLFSYILRFHESKESWICMKYELMRNSECTWRK